MSDDAPIDRKKHLEGWLRVADQQLTKLREVKQFQQIRSAGRDGSLIELQIQPRFGALQAFLIADLERQILLKQNELRRTRFDVAEYLRAKLAETEAEIHDAAREAFDK